MTAPVPGAPRAPIVTIVLPAKNEEAALGRTLRSLPRLTLQAFGLGTEVFVLDGHSQDATSRIARQAGATVVPDVVPGKGSALRNAVGLFHGDYVVMLDADGTYPPDAIPRMVAPLVRGEADVVMGVRVPQAGAMPTIHIVGNAMLSLMATVLYRRLCPDVCTGMWAFRVQALRSLPLRSRRFGLEAELFALAARLGLRVARVNVDYLPRHGPAKLSFGHDGLRIVRRLMRSRFVPLKGAASANGNGGPAPHARWPPEVQA